MRFFADLHIHSKFSRATSKNLDLENLYIVAQIKGITVVGTGDAIHPGWFAELKEKLVPAEQGLFKLRKDIAEICDKEVPPSCRGPVRFILQTEISNIYKKGEFTRKNHNLIFLPHMEAAETFKSRLDAIGNIHSDGRPILGLDAKHLLEISLEVSSDAFLIPAHIWTPWFSMLGSKSGFDSLEECFEDLSPQIFAVETGLSSDPLMNRRVSNLDGLSLVSNSDAHSPANLGREANLFDTTLSFSGIRSALNKKERNGFLGTIEFYPEEGKYHLDGHRKCKLRCHPQETESLKELCPACGKPLTLGVLNRVMTLADRQNGEGAAPRDRFFHRVPLVDVLSEILQTGPKSKKVQRAYQALIEKFGNELSILNDIHVEELKKSGLILLSHAVDRMRSGRIRLYPGYDGEYGKIQIFNSEERKRLLGHRSMFDMSTEKVQSKPIKKGKTRATTDAKTPGKTINQEKSPTTDKKPTGLSPPDMPMNKAQKAAVTHPSGPLLIVAGPGTGKTLTLTHRIAFLMHEKRVSPDNMLAITFTNKAAQEMQKRLSKLLGENSRLPQTATFHQFCLQLLKEKDVYKNYAIIEERERKQLISHAIKNISQKGKEVKVDREVVLTTISNAKQRMVGPGTFVGEDVSEQKIISEIYRIYNESLKIQKLFDFEDLIYTAVTEMESNEMYRRQCRNRFKYIFIDEYQDLNQAQYRLIRALSSPDTNICVIGDPDQSIYGFRGSDYKYFINFIDDYPETKVVFLERNYRSTQVILKAAYQVMEGHQLVLSTQYQKKRDVYSCIEGKKKNVHILETSSETAEADAVARTIEKMVGGAGYHAIDAGRIGQAEISRPVGFSDVAILYRTGDQHRIISESLSRHGIPFQVAGRGGGGDASEIKQLLSLFKVVNGSGHYGDFEKVVDAWQPGIGKETVFSFCHWGLSHGYDLEKAMTEAKRFPIQGMSRQRQEKVVDLFKILKGFYRKMDDMSFSDKLRYLLTHTRLEQRIKENQTVSAICDRLLASIEKSDLPPDAFFSRRALETDVDTLSFDVQKVTLLTLHAAKGLEFPVVFIVGCEKDLIPLHRAENEEHREDEERRLFFVALTRAKEQLFLTWARKRRRFGRTLSRQLSPFVSDIADELLVRQELVYGTKRRQVQTQMKLF